MDDSNEGAPVPERSGGHAAQATPGRRPWPRWLQVLLLVLLAIGILVLLFTVVFPWVEANISNPTVSALVSGAAAGRA